MPSASSTFHKIFRTIDLFQTSKLLRYNYDTEYKTTTGGICSAAIIIFLIGLFSNVGIKTINKQIISSSAKMMHEDDPSQLTFTTDSNGDLMFALYLRGIDLNSGPKLFDIVLHQDNYSTGYNLVTRKQIPLVQCTLEHFNFTEEIAQSYTDLNLSRCLCPPLGQKFTVKGKISKASFNQLRLKIYRCNTTTDSNCANDSIFSAYQAIFGNFNLAFAIINTNINPMDSNYMRKYVDDRNIILFSSQLGVNLAAEVQCDLIQTDQSLTPFKNIRSQKIVHIPQRLTYLTYFKKSNQDFVTIVMKKSEKSVIYSRSFNKIDQYLSYIGGLVGTFIGLIFIMRPYTEKCYEISLAKKLMVDNNRQEIKSHKFSMFTYLGILLKKAISFFGFNPNWQNIDNYIESSQELIMQIDVTYIVRKLMFLDAAIGKLMQKDQIEALCMREKPTIKKTKLQRKIHFAPELIHQHKIHIKNIQRQLAEGQSMHDEYIIKDIIERTPNKLMTIHTQSGKIEDASALSFSQNSEYAHNFKDSICRVMEEGIVGKQTPNYFHKQQMPDCLKQSSIPDKKDKEQVDKKKEIEIVDIESANPIVFSFQEGRYSIMKIHLKKKEEPEQQE